MRLPDVPPGLRLGVGLDLPWGANVGFNYVPGRGEVVSDSVVRFLSGHAHRFAHIFVSWQPRSRNLPDAAEYFPAYDDLFARIPPFPVRALHQTAFNNGALEPYDRGPMIDLTNALIERYRLAWVNEDLGLWSLHGRRLPYPLPPYLTEAGLRAAVRNTDEVQRALAVPLLVEFPGFSAGTSFCVGPLHAYDVFRRVVEDTGSPATLDTGHLLSYQWLRGRRGEALYSELDRLPLAHCFEIHLSGCVLLDERFFDYHHGILLNEQMELLTRLIPRCPNLRAVTYEDPKFTADGALLPETASSFIKLAELAEGVGRVISLDVALDRLLHKPGVLREFLARGPAALDVAPDDAAALATIDPAELARTARQVLDNIFNYAQRGSGDLLAVYSGTFAANVDTVESLAAAFLESSAFDAYREIPFSGAGCCLEEAFYRFVEVRGLGEPEIREQEFLAAIIKALVMSPRPDFTIPAEVQRAPGGYLAVTTRSGPTLFAALGGRYVTGPITPFLAELLRSPDAAETVARRHGVTAEVLAASLDHLAGLGLVAADINSAARRRR